MRSDILVSIGVVDERGPAATLPRLATLTAELAKSFAYFEVLYVLPESARSRIDGFAHLIATLPNLRIIFAGEGTRFYRRRLIAAVEAIGDVVAVVDLDEVSFVTLASQLDAAHARGEILIGWRQSAAPANLTYRLLSLISRNVVSAQAARTIILPRDLMDTVASRRTAALDLRFEPRNALSRYRRFDVDGSIGKGEGGKRGMGGRDELLLEILLSGVPRYLKAYAAAGFGVMLGSLLYAVYAVAIVLLRDDVQEGWFSTAVVQAGSTAFIAGGMAMLAVAMIALYELQHGGDDRVIVDEISNTSFFAHVTDRNVELVASDPLPGAAVEPARPDG